MIGGTLRPAFWRYRAGVAVAGLLACALVGCSAEQPHPHAATPARITSRARQPAGVTGHSLDDLLPLSHAELRTAVHIALRFATAYSTYRYDQPAATYLAQLRPLATDTLWATMTRDARDRGLRAQRSRDQQVAVGEATATKIRVLAPDSVILLVHLRQDLTTTSGTGHRTQRLAVTDVLTGGRWKVDDIQLAGQGDQGESADAGSP